MVEKISSAKDLELDQMQLKVKAFEGGSIHNTVSMFNICAYTFELSLFMKISLLSSSKAFINVSTLYAFIHACTACLRMTWDSVFLCFTEALYEKKQRTVAYDSEIAKLQAQVEHLESAAKEIQGKVIR